MNSADFVMDNASRWSINEEQWNMDGRQTLPAIINCIRKVWVLIHKLSEKRWIQSHDRIQIEDFVLDSDSRWSITEEQCNMDARQTVPAIDYKECYNPMLGVSIHKLVDTVYPHRFRIWFWTMLLSEASLKYNVTWMQGKH